MFALRDEGKLIGYYEKHEYRNTEKMKLYDLRQVKQMNIQIFGTKKCNDTKKAERFFKERGIKYQFIDMKEKGMSKGEFTSVAQANGGLENMINWEEKDQDTLALIKYIADEDKLEKVLENPQVIKTPVVRNGKQSTLGYQPDVWKGWYNGKENVKYGEYHVKHYPYTTSRRTDNCIHRRYSRCQSGIQACFRVE